MTSAPDNIDEVTLGDVCTAVSIGQPDVFTTKTTVANALLTFKRKGFLSAPVLSPDGASYLGIVDVLDLTGRLVFMALEGTERKFFSETITRSIGVAHPTGSLVRERMTSSLRSCMQRFSADTQRVLIVPENKGEEAPAESEGAVVLTQRDLVTYLSKNPQLFQAKASRRLSELHLSTETKVITVESGESVLEGFKGLVLEQEYIYGVPIVDPSSQQVVGNLSASDIRELNRTDGEKILGTPVLEWLAARDGGSARKPVLCKPDETFIDVIRRVVDEKVHRAYLVNDSGHVVGVVSLTDIINEIHLEDE